MQRSTLFLVLLLVPASVQAAPVSVQSSFSAGQSLVAASSSPGNAYAAGTSIILTAPVAGDFSAFGGSVVTAAPITGDDLIIAGSISSRASVGGDLRAFGGSIDITQPIGGDLVTFGFSVHDSARPKGSVLIAAVNAAISDGAGGPVTVYGNSVSLAGHFMGDVHIVAGGHISIAPGTEIRGKLSYEAPEMAVIPDSAVIMGGVSYTNVSYLPDIGTSRALAFISIGFFLVARIVSMLILAGLLAGLFPAFARKMTEIVSANRLRDIFLAFLLGFAIFVAAPIAIVLLVLTFVGIGLALLLFVLYMLLAVLAVLYTGILAGSILVRRFLKRENVLWHDGVIGMALVSLVSLIPIAGIFLVACLTFFSAGTLLQVFFRFAFPHEADTSEMV